MHLMLGNHDRHTAFFSVMGAHAASSPAQGHQVRLLQTPNANWFLLDSLPGGDPLSAARGHLGAEQRTWLADTLDTHADRPAVIVAHHHLNIPGKLRVPLNLKDFAQLLDIMTARPHVKAYIHGHVHMLLARRYKGLHILSLPSVSYPFVAGHVLGWLLAQARPDRMDLTVRARITRRPAHNRRIPLVWR